MAKIRLGALGFTDEDILNNEGTIKPISKLLRYFSLYGCLNYCIRAAENDRDLPDDTDTAAEAADSSTRAQQAEAELSGRGIRRVIPSDILRFSEDIHRYRFFKGSCSVESLIRKIYSETDILSIVSSLL